MRSSSHLLILAVALTATLAVLSLTGCRAKPSAETDARSNRVTAADPANTPDTSLDNDPPDPPVATADPNDHRPIIACFGDSLTAGFGADAGQSYPDFLQRDLDTAGFHCRVVDEGISGNTTKDGVNRIHTVLALKPALVLVEFGGNDGLRGVPIADSRAALDQIVSTLQAGGTQVALAGITLPPDYGPDYIKQFTETYTLLAAKYHVRLLPFLLQGVYGVDGMMQADRTHATDKGNQVVAQNVMSLIKPLLKK